MKKTFCLLALFLALGLSFNTANAQQTLQEATDSIKNIVAQAKDGDAAAQNTLGVWYYKGEHVTQNYSEAAKWWALSAQQEYPRGIANLALCYYTGNGVEPDSIRALNLYKRAIKKDKDGSILEQNEAAAKDGNVFYCISVAQCYQSGIGTAKDFGSASMFYQKAARAGSVDAMRELGMMYLNAKQADKAYPWFEKGAEANSLPCIYYTGYLLMEGKGVAQDKQSGFNYLLKAANEGLPAAENAVAQAYLTGSGTVKNTETGMQWLVKAANDGVAKAQNQLAIAYVKGDGVPVDYNMAARWFAACANAGTAKSFPKLFEEGGELAGSPFQNYLVGMRYYYEKDYVNALAQFKIVDKAKQKEGKLMEGVILLNPDYAKYNQKKGIDALKKAAKEEIAMAQYLLGYYYETGENNVPVDKETALEYLQQAASQGYAPAICYLADMYYEGRGVEQSYDKAVELYLSVKALLSPSAEKRLAMCYENGWGGLPVDKEKAESLSKKKVMTVQELVKLVPVPAKK